MSMAEQFRRHILASRLDSGPYAVARQVFVDRNAQGYPENVRANAVAITREPHRRALRHARAAKTALLAGDETQYRIAMLEANLALQFAATAFRQVYIDWYRRRQSVRASAPRKRIDSDNLDAPASIAEIVRSIAFWKDAVGDYYPTRELWNEAYNRIGDAVGEFPDETFDDRENPVSMNYPGGSVTYASFKVLLSRIRNPKASTS